MSQNRNIFYRIHIFLQSPFSLYIIHQFSKSFSEQWTATAKFSYHSHNLPDIIEQSARWQFIVYFINDIPYWKLFDIRELHFCDCDRGSVYVPWFHEKKKLQFILKLLIRYVTDVKDENVKQINWICSIGWTANVII